MPLVNIKLDSDLIEKVRTKLKAHPDAPANYIVDQILRNYAEE